VTDWIHLSTMRFFARHGVHADERELGQTYLLDVSLAYDLSRAGRTDDLADTVDYGTIHRIAKDVIEGPPRNLVERVAEETAERLLRETPAQTVRVRLRKPHPPIAGADIEEESVEIERAR